MDESGIDALDGSLCLWADTLQCRLDSLDWSRRNGYQCGIVGYL